MSIATLVTESRRGSREKSRADYGRLLRLSGTRKMTPEETAALVDAANAMGFTPAQITRHENLLTQERDLASQLAAANEPAAREKLRTVTAEDNAIRGGLHAEELRLLGEAAKRWAANPESKRFTPAEVPGAADIRGDMRNKAEAAEPRLKALRTEINAARARVNDIDALVDRLNGVRTEIANVMGNA